MRKKMGESIFQTAKRVESKEIKYKNMTAEELKPTDKGYIGLLSSDDIKGNDDIAILGRANYMLGYIRALEHNNVPELIEAVKRCVIHLQFSSSAIDSQLCQDLRKVVTKAEQNKLNK